METTNQQIKQAFQDAKTWADANSIIAKMTTEQVIEMRDALANANKWTSLTMRDDFVLGLLQSEVDRRAVGGKK